MNVLISRQSIQWLSKFFSLDQSGGQTDIAILIAWLKTFGYIVINSCQILWSPEDFFCVLLTFLWHHWATRVLRVGKIIWFSWLQGFFCSTTNMSFLFRYSIPLLLTRSSLLIASSTFIKGAIFFFSALTTWPQAAITTIWDILKCQRSTCLLWGKSKYRAKCHG